jgi:protein gp37
MENTKIRWATNSWNFTSGCTEVSPGCDHCYAKVIAEKFRGGAFPNGFDPTFKRNKLNDPRKRSGAWRDPGRVFVNSMSDLFHPAFSTAQIDAGMDVMADVDRHDYLLLTKRPNRMAKYFAGKATEKSPRSFAHSISHTKDTADSWLARHDLRVVPPQIWVGTTIESDDFTWRADWLRAIPAAVRFLSVEPMLGPVPSLNLAGIGWVICGGESGNGTRNFRPIDKQWARDLRDRCADAGVAFYWKQDSGTRTETGITLDGEALEQYPLEHPATRTGPRTLGRYVDAPAAHPPAEQPAAAGRLL